MNQMPQTISFSPAKTNPFTPVTPEGQPIFFSALHQGSGVVNVWSWDKTGAKSNPDKARKLLKETLSKFNKDPRNSAQQAKAVTDKNIIGFNAVVDYFPHVGPAEIAQGWYDRFNALNGEDHTVYASGLNAFETVEHALRAGEMWWTLTCNRIAV
ncbi:unnamed protein product [Parascedosporium putredinis]|uniref:Uncharacterized protein n=1 Tax=Parascedosporium putredinis TaxID=1442378 RepID=A0A9P1M749_9PEZI|nr:unnamed protein product [Parascedosporium putredinis]CAI7990924.1 unnamed protein product [Parascedosporium putredinis]